MKGVRLFFLEGSISEFRFLWLGCTVGVQLGCGWDADGLSFVGPETRDFDPNAQIHRRMMAVALAPRSAKLLAAESQFKQIERSACFIVPPWESGQGETIKTHILFLHVHAQTAPLSFGSVFR